jgi:hypothetical protein
MEFVCDKHVLKGMQMLNAPHIEKASPDCTCSFCKKEAIYQISYFLGSDYGRMESRELHKLKTKGILPFVVGVKEET